MRMMNDCKNHPRYTAAKPPKSPCEPCWDMYVNGAIMGVDWDKCSRELYATEKKKLVKAIVKLGTSTVKEDYWYWGGWG